MRDDLEVMVEPGSLFLNCKHLIFAKIRDAILDSGNLVDFPGLDSAQLNEIHISNYKDERPATTWRGYLWLFGCGLFSCSLLFVLITGITTIISWFLAAP